MTALPWSPTHVTEKDRRYQLAVGKLLKGLGYEVEQANPKLSRWDLRCRLPGFSWTYVEVKAPKIDWEGRWVPSGLVGRYPVKGAFVTASKAEAILKIGPTWLVVVATDLVARVARLTTERLATYDVDFKDTNVYRKNRGDPKDKAVKKYIVPFEHFHVLGPIELE